MLVWGKQSNQNENRLEKQGAIDEGKLDKARTILTAIEDDIGTDDPEAAVRYSLAWKKLADYYRIPYRTIQDWYMEKRNMPDFFTLAYDLQV